MRARTTTAAVAVLALLGLTGCSSGDGPVAASMTDSTPSSASARPSVMITSTPTERAIGTTS